MHNLVFIICSLLVGIDCDWSIRSLMKVTMIFLNEKHALLSSIRSPECWKSHCKALNFQNFLGKHVNPLFQRQMFSINQITNRRFKDMTTLKFTIYLMQIEVHSSKVNLKLHTVTAASLPWLTNTLAAAWIKRKRDWDGTVESLVTETSIRWTGL